MDTLPADPPQYASDSEARHSQDSSDSLVRDLEQMQLEQEEYPQQSPLQRLRRSFNSKVVTPVQRILDPVAEAYSYGAHKFEAYLSKIGNPLILKRFGYVILVSVLLYLITTFGSFPRDGSRVSGGSFSDRGLLEDYILQNINLQQMETNLEYLSSIPHVAGTSGDLTLARYIYSSLQDSGFQIIQFEEFKTTLTYPNHTTISHDNVQLDISQQFMPLSKNGKVSGPLIYGNYGLQKDFKKLIKSGIEVKGSILVLKFSESVPQSLQILYSQNYGCNGVLFISESTKFPDSFAKKSAAIPEFYLGDPLTPGWTTGQLNQKISLKDSTIAKIPTASITRNQVKPLLSKLGDKGVKFEDGLYSGDSSLIIDFENSIILKDEHPIWNVIGKIQGKEQDDKALIIGAQRDAPCKGAIYPNTGTVILLELAKLFMSLSKNFNWKPLRSIYFISFDGTEYNLAGAAELLEFKTREIKKETTAFIDLSDAVAGDSLSISANPLLESLLSPYQSTYNFSMSSLKEYKNYLPFMTEGVPSMEINFKGLDYPKYSCQDDFSFFRSDGDFEFSKHRTLVELISKISLHLIEDPLIPFDISIYVERLNEYFADLQNYAHSIDPSRSINFQPIMEGLLHVKRVGRDLSQWEKTWTDIINDNGGVEPSFLALHRWNWNKRLNAFEKLFLKDEGLPNRRWFKNPIFGPQLFKPEDGDFEWWTFPAVRDAIFKKDWDAVQSAVDDLGRHLSDGAETFIQG